MKKKIFELKFDEVENKIVLTAERSLFLIFEGDFWTLEKCFQVKGNFLKNSYVHLQLFNKTMVFLDLNYSFFFFDFSLKKFFFSLKPKFPFLAFSNSFIKPNFFQMENRKISFMLNLSFFFEFFCLSIYIRKFSNKKNKDKRSISFIYKRKLLFDKIFPRKKKDSVCESTFNTNSCFLFEKLNQNIIICWDLSSKRVVFELTLTNFKKMKFSTFFFRKRTKIAGKLLKRNKRLLQKNLLVNLKIKKSKNYFQIFTIISLLKKVSFIFSTKKQENFSNFWEIFIFVLPKTNKACLGLDVWEKDKKQSWDLIEPAHRELDLTSYKLVKSRKKLFEERTKWIIFSEC